jgi:hypothetical protein
MQSTIHRKTSCCINKQNISYWMPPITSYSYRQLDIRRRWHQDSSHQCLQLLSFSSYWQQNSSRH